MGGVQIFAGFLYLLTMVNGNQESEFEKAPADQLLTVHATVTARSISECGFTCLYLLNSMCLTFGWNALASECAISKIGTSTTGQWGGQGSVIYHIESEEEEDLCSSALLLTDYWRKVYNTSEMWRENCDARDMVAQGRPWFRFSGAAGNKLLNHCVPHSSCGTHAVMWSNAAMPAAVGEEKRIYVKTSYDASCVFTKRKVRVKKCSSKSNDYAYKYADQNTTCPYGFCGMD